MKKIVLGILIFLLVVTITGCDGLGGDSTPNSTPDSTPNSTPDSTVDGRLSYENGKILYKIYESNESRYEFSIEDKDWGAQLFQINILWFDPDDSNDSSFFDYAYIGGKENVKFTETNQWNGWIIGKRLSSLSKVQLSSALPSEGAIRCYLVSEAHPERNKQFEIPADQNAAIHQWISYYDNDGNIHLPLTGGTVTATGEINSINNGAALSYTATDSTIGKLCLEIQSPAYGESGGYAVELMWGPSEADRQYADIIGWSMFEYAYLEETPNFCYEGNFSIGDMNNRQVWKGTDAKGFSRAALQTFLPAGEWKFLFENPSHPERKITWVIPEEKTAEILNWLGNTQDDEGTEVTIWGNDAEIVSIRDDYERFEMWFRKNGSTYTAEIYYMLKENQDESYFDAAYIDGVDYDYQRDCVVTARNGNSQFRFKTEGLTKDTLLSYLPASDEWTVKLKSSTEGSHTRSWIVPAAKAQKIRAWLNQN